MSTRTVVRTCVLLFCVSQALFLFRITSPPNLSFDEIMYVLPAQKMLSTGIGETNRAHPPLAQMLIALSMRIFGDQPLGWRFLSSIFGGFTIVGVYAWALAIFRKHSIAVWIAVIALLNQMVYVLARTGMLDIFVITFFVWGVTAFCAAWTRDVEPANARRLVVMCGAMFGLMTACKWLGIVAIGSALGMIAFALLFRRFFRQDAAALPGDDEPWLSPGTLPGVGIGTLVISFLVLPVAIYFAAHIPFLFFPGPDATLAGVTQHQAWIWKNHTTIPAGPAQMSPWYAWPFDWRPVWFYFVREGTDHGRTVLFSGNPVIMWGGLAAVFACAWLWIRTRSRRAFLALAWWGALYLCWAVVPIRTAFLYYYAPALLAIGPALAVCVERWPKTKLFGLPWYWTFAVAAAIAFAIDLPLLSGMRVPLDWIGR
jgi:dolichyl-phosphate-mannose-protein mannosyltransferase